MLLILLGYRKTSYFYSRITFKMLVLRKYYFYLFPSISTFDILYGYFIVKNTEEGDKPLIIFKEISHREELR